MAAVNVMFPGNLAQVAAADSLRLIPSSLIPAGSLYVVTELGKLFAYDPGSLLPDNNTSTLKPFDKTPLQTGRWLYQVDGLAAGPTGPADNTYTSYTAMQASDPTRKSARLVGDTDNPPHPDGPYNNPTQTVGGWVPQQSEGIAYSRNVNIALPLDKSLPRTLAWLANVDQFTTADQYTKLQDAFDIANAEGYQDIHGHAEAVYRKDGQLLVTNGFDGRGCTFQALSNGPQAINVYTINGHTVAPGMRLRNFTTLGAATVRTSAPGDCGLTIGQAGVPSISDIVLENIRVGSVDDDPNRGHAAAGIAIANTSRVWVYNPIVKNCLADGIHFLHGSQDGYVYGAIVENSGDDAASVVSYRYYGALCNNILFDRLLAVNSRSRGCAVVGGRNVRYTNPTIRGSAGAAVYIFSEASFDTYGCDNIEVLGLTAEGCVVGGGAASGNPNFQNGIVMMGGRDGQDVINGEIFARSVRDCTVTGLVRASGDRASQGLENNNPFVIRPRVSLDIQGIPLNIPGALVGGMDADTQITGRDLGGVPIVIGANAAGRHLIHDSKFDRARTTNPAANVNVLLNAAPNVTELRMERCEFNDTSGTFYNTDSGFDLTKLRNRNIKINGTEVAGKDYATGTPTFANSWTGAGFVLIKRTDGFVAFDGIVSGGVGADATLIMQLPLGYRPRTTRRYQAPNGSGTTTMIEIRSDGGVIIVSGGADNISLNLEYLGG